MKRIFIVLYILLATLSISTHVLAHSHFEASNPADGDIITEPLNEIILEFDGQIEQGSFLDISSTENEIIELQDLIVNDSTLTGVFTKPLPNNDYHVSWNIISADGHPVEGEFSFTVDAEIPESIEDKLLEREELEEEDTVVETETIEVENSTEELTEGEDSASKNLILIAAIAIIVIIVFFLLSKRKR